MTKSAVPANEPQAAKYINPLTDFGFKRIFGTEANKDLLIDFLESVLSIEGGIRELHYANPEHQGRLAIDRRAIFDLYCITGRGEHIQVEVQNVRQDYFKDRALYYASFPVQKVTKAFSQSIKVAFRLSFPKSGCLKLPLALIFDW
jgi:hypothetical protein